MVLSCGEKHHNNDGSDHGVTKMLVIITTTIKSLSWSSSVLRQETRQERDQVVPIEETHLCTEKVQPMPKKRKP
jgi:acyl-CoA thioesterase FadM